MNSNTLQDSPAGDAGRPFFSVIVPVWNRATILHRCLDSVLSQDFADFEIVAVDDGSEDDSVAVMQTITDPRLRVIRLPETEASAPACGVATKEARGVWHVRVDTDWELLPGALTRLAEMARQAPADVFWVGGYARTERGEIWPVAPLPEGPFGFEQYLAWFEATGTAASDYTSCRRAEMFETVHWPTDRRLELQMTLRMAKRWRFWVSHEVVAKAYTDSPNRIATDRLPAGLNRKMRSAGDMATMYEEIVNEFGADFRHHAPDQYQRLLRFSATFNFLASRRLRGLKFAFRAIARRPWDLQMWGITALGVIGPGAIQRVRSWKWLRRMMRTGR